MGAKGWDLNPPSATFPEKKKKLQCFIFIALILLGLINAQRFLYNGYQ